MSTRKRFRTAKETAGSADLYEHRENAMFGVLRNSRAFKATWALLLAKRDGRPYPAHRLKEIGDAICSGDASFLKDLKTAMDFFRDVTITNGKVRLADPLRFYLCEFALAWAQWFGSRVSPTLRDVRRSLSIWRVVSDGCDVRDDTLRDIWTKELKQTFAPAGRPRRNKDSERLRERFFKSLSEK
jgi:hypothetical protein